MAIAAAARIRTKEEKRLVRDSYSDTGTGREFCPPDTNGDQMGNV